MNNKISLLVFGCLLQVDDDKLATCRSSIVSRRQGHEAQPTCSGKSKLTLMLLGWSFAPTCKGPLCTQLRDEPGMVAYQFVKSLTGLGSLQGNVASRRNLQTGAKTDG